MRIMKAAVLTLLAASAGPSVGFAQIVIPYTKAEESHVDRLDHAVPVGTVTRTGDPIALATPQPGDGFVLGAAKLDIKDPDHPMMVFTIGNGSGAPIPLSSVMVHVATVNTRVDDSAALIVACGYGFGARLTDIMTVHHAVSGDTTLRPGTTLTLAMPVEGIAVPTRTGDPARTSAFLFT
jgi:hypothetical protein